LAIETQLVNSRILSPDVLDDYAIDSRFPYKESNN